MPVVKASPLQLQLQFTRGDPPILAGTVGNGKWLAGITAYGAVFNARTNPAPFAGKYTLAIEGPNDGNVQEPQGNGYGTATVNTAGELIFHGTLADGTAIRQVAFLSADGLWPLYASLYGGHGQIIGWVNFTNTATSDLSGSLVWSKLPMTGATSYAAGFDFAPAVEGSDFMAGTAKAPLLDFSAGVVFLTEGGIADYTNYFTVGSGERLIGSNRMTLDFTPSSGVFTGTAANPIVGHAPLSFSGIYLSKENYGLGHFINAGMSGAVYLGPQ